MTNFEGKNSLVASCQCKCNPLPSGPLFIMHNNHKSIILVMVNLIWSSEIMAPFSYFNPLGGNEVTK
jgi:hypothetical protein